MKPNVVEPGVRTRLAVVPLILVLLPACYESHPDSADAEADARGDGVHDADVGDDVRGDVCTPIDCTGRECGDDGCGGTCGAGCSAAETCGTDGICALAGETWVLLPAGTFRMGAPERAVGTTSAETQHTVTLTHRFEIPSTEVTQREFETRMGYNPSHHTGCPDCPVEQVNWHEAAAYCNALSAATARPSCYTCSGSGSSVTCSRNWTNPTPYDCPGYRLPTEAEWEHAARAGTSTATYGGELAEGHLYCEEPDIALDGIAWFCGNSGGASHAVGTRTPNAWGFFDMLGNVYEWCEDWWEFSAYGPGAVTDPWGPFVAGFRTIRGGSWAGGAQQARAPYRDGRDPGVHHNEIGFRPARCLP